MPNWCYNNVDFWHDNEEELAKFDDRVNRGLFQRFMPVDEDAGEHGHDKWCVLLPLMQIAFILALT